MHRTPESVVIKACRKHEEVKDGLEADLRIAVWKPVWALMVRDDTQVDSTDDRAAVTGCASS